MHESFVKTWVCPTCGTQNHDMFCIHCGTKSSEATNDDSHSNEWVCSKCKQINQGVFCIRCGCRHTDHPAGQQIARNGFVENHKGTIQTVFVAGLIALVFLEGNRIWNVMTNDKSPAVVTTPTQQQSSSHASSERIMQSPDEERKSAISIPQSLPTLPSEKVQKNDVPQKNGATPAPPAHPAPSAPSALPASGGGTDITPNQRAAISALHSFHNYITQHDLRQAYNCLSPDLQGSMSYEGWAPGFNTTVSSIASDVKVASSSDNKIVLTYILTAVDNPGGTQKFNGTVSVVRTNSGWKIDEIENTVR